ALIGRVLGIVCRVIVSHLIKQAGYPQQSARTGAITLIHRFGSALNIHFPMLFLHGVYVVSPNGARPRFQWVREPTSAQLSQLAARSPAGSGDCWSAKGWKVIPSNSIWAKSSTRTTQCP